VRCWRGSADRLDERGLKSRTPGVTRQGSCRTGSAQHGSRRAGVPREEEGELGAKRTEDVEAADVELIRPTGPAAPLHPEGQRGNRIGVRPFPDAPPNFAVPTNERESKTWNQMLEGIESCNFE
jgi:hypothetical protein